MTTHDRKGMVFISWAPFCSRSDGIAHHLDGRSFMVYSAGFGSNYVTVLFKYLSQTIKTLRILLHERPSAVFVMTPPVAACIPVWIYCRLTGTPYVIDAHTGAFLDRRWRWFLFVHRWFSRAARTTIVTNEYMYAVVSAWSARVTLVRDVPVCFAEPKYRALEGSRNMTLVATFTRDEPIALFLEAAAKLPDVHFYVTGNYRRASQELVAAKPANVTFTGFLPDAEYVGLLLSSDAVISLTTLDHTMQRGAYEAVYLGRPVITSNFEVLRKHFSKGTVHVDNTVDGLIAGLRHMRDNAPAYAAEIADLRRERLEDWRRAELNLRQLVSPERAMPA